MQRRCSSTSSLTIQEIDRNATRNVITMASNECQRAHLESASPTTRICWRGRGRDSVREAGAQSSACAKTFAISAVSVRRVHVATSQSNVTIGRSDIVATVRSIRAESFADCCGVAASCTANDGFRAGKSADILAETDSCRGRRWKLFHIAVTISIGSSL